MDPALLGAIIGFSTLVGIGGLRYMYHKCRKHEEPVYIRNPLLIKHHSSVKKLFV
jgi:hypothetical protein